MNDEKIRNACSGVHPSGERYPDGWPVRPLDELATALFEAQGPESKFADLEEHNRDDYRFEAVAAEEFFSKKISALEAERDALQELVDAYDGYAVSMNALVGVCEPSGDDMASVRRSEENVDTKRIALIELRKAAK